MTEITNEMWKKAISKLLDMYDCNATDPSINLKIVELTDRYYEDGDRSTELYNAIMELN